MSVRKRRFKKEGKSMEQWFVDFRFKHADGTAERFRIDSPVNTSTALSSTSGKYANSYRTARSVAKRRSPRMR